MQSERLRLSASQVRHSQSVSPVRKMVSPLGNNQLTSHQFSAVYPTVFLSRVRGAILYLAADTQHTRYRRIPKE